MIFGHSIATILHSLLTLIFNEIKERTFFNVVAGPGITKKALKNHTFSYCVTKSNYCSGKATLSYSSYRILCKFQ
jgi:hypothetical protein